MKQALSKYQDFLGLKVTGKHMYEGTYWRAYKYRWNARARAGLRIRVLTSIGISSPAEQAKMYTLLKVT
jgi:hypothetical protein